MGWNADDGNVLKRGPTDQTDRGRGLAFVIEPSPLAEECIFAVLSLVLASHAAETIKLQ